MALKSFKSNLNKFEFFTNFHSKEVSYWELFMLVLPESQCTPSPAGGAPGGGGGGGGPRPFLFLPAFRFPAFPAFPADGLLRT